MYKNHVAALSFLNAANNTNLGNANLEKYVALERDGFGLITILSQSVQDEPAKGVATRLGFDDEVRSMCDEDKVGASTIGHLSRTKKKLETHSRKRMH